MRTALVLFTRDLRIHDQPALATAARFARHVVPAFVIDEALLDSGFASPNRLTFMLDCLADLDRSLAKCGARVVVRCSAVVEETMRLVRQIKAVAIFASADVSAHARRREARLAGACREVGLEFRTFPGICVVDPGTLRPSSGSDHFRVFTPYWRRWRRMPLRPIAPTPARLDMPPGLALGRPPGLRELTHGAPSPELPAGGETVGRTRLAAWIRSGLRRYGVDRDDLGADAASHLSAYVHFGCRRRGRSSRV